ncbi:trypsin-like peptidase domain-containing protein [Candidatus Uhrbacteria bacterium]|nr:trypsin-like peptidase domain-containing protein [Candidatus Uhrbacteria bacterium]
MHTKHVRTPLLSFLAIVLIAATAGFGGGLLGSLYGQGVMITGSSDINESPVNPDQLKITEDSATVNVVKNVSPSVVSIVVSKDISQVVGRTGDIFPFDDFFEFGFPFDFKFDPAPNGNGGQQQKKESGEKKKQQVGGGSGFIVTKDGMILTNKHVVSDPDADYTVVTNDGKEYTANVLATDPINDVAIVKIEAAGLVPVEWGNSDDIQIGQTVIAIGYSLGEYRNTVTRGVVSGIDRVVQATDGAGRSEVIQEAIQTDAAINPGNSGGPLLSLSGHVIGINTAVNRAGQSIGFAIPINIAKRPLESVIKHGRIIRPFLGVRYRLVNEEMVKKNNLRVHYGAFIAGNPDANEFGIVSDSPAQKAGLREGDIILEVNGERVDLGHALANLIVKYAPGDTVMLKVLSGAEEKEVSVTLGEFKEESKP